MLKDIYAKGIVYQKVLPRLTMSSSTNFYKQPIDSDKKAYEENQVNNRSR